MGPNQGRQKSYGEKTAKKCANRSVLVSRHMKSALQYGTRENQHPEWNPNHLALHKKYRKMLSESSFDETGALR